MYNDDEDMINDTGENGEVLNNTQHQFLDICDGFK